MNRFDPPGFLDDLSDPQIDQWSQGVSGWLDEAKQGRPEENDGPRGQFFNPLTDPPAQDAQVAVISWNAFPRQVKAKSLSDKQRWRTADSARKFQDEYCEWSVDRDVVTKKITRVTFTCEGPEYWHALAALNPNKVLELYQRFISPKIKRGDIFTNGTYNPLNRFNNSTTGGAMHLIQAANTLRAEIELAAAATIRRVRDGQELTDAQELIECSSYGEPERNSDPHIGEQVNALARQRADITLNNPIGLYFHDFNPVGWKTPDGEDPTKFWTYVRGKNDHFVRAVFEVPAGRGYVVGDIKIAGKPIAFGAQIADFVTIKLEGLATRIGQSIVAPFQGCRGVAPSPSALAAPPEMDAPTMPFMPLRSRVAGVAGDTQDTGDAGAASPPGFVGAESDATGQELIDRLPEALRREFELVEADAAGVAALLPYPKLPSERLKAVRVSGRILAYASPDSTYAVTKKLLDSARRSIVVGIYDFSAGYMKDHLKRALSRGVKVSLMLDTNSDEERELLTSLETLGANCSKAPSSSSGSPNAVFGNAHEKIIVVDDEIVMIQSGNWSENSIPFNEGDGVVEGHFRTGNRDMGLAVHSKKLATFFAELVARDMRLARGEAPDAPLADAPPDALAAASPASDIFFEAAPPNAPTQLFHSITVTPDTPVKVTPVITPENFHDTVKAVLRSAQSSIRIEQQYIRGGQDAVEA
ncbi:MAG TPA: phospholipase D-like domain-containing protein, partial [Chloroflexia bacterium]